MAKKLNDIAFHNGQRMPIVGLGTWQATEEEIGAAVDAALEAGYKHIDTAYYYKNEVAIGKSLKKWLDSGKIKREDLFVVTKLPNTANRAECVEKYMKISLEALQLSYVDLYLIHHPVGMKEVKEGGKADDPKNLFKNSPVLDLSTDHISIWKAMEAQVNAGRTRSIGLSNFNSSQIARIVKAARIRPANLQVELHVYFQQRELVAFCRALDITVCAYAPIGSPGLKSFMEKIGDASDIPELTPLSDPVVLRIANAHNKTPANILLRHIMQRGIAVIPKSINPKRVKENFQVFDFELTESEVEELDALDKTYKGRLFAGGPLKIFNDHPEYPLNERY